MSGELLSLQIKDPVALGRITRGIENAVQRSFAESRVAIPTAAETKRRVGICIQLVRELHGDLDWSSTRIADALPRGLRAKLDGTKWDPQNERHIWTPPRDLVVPGH